MRGALGIAMSIVERVENLLRDYEGDPCCDDHITKKLALKSRRQAQRAISSIMIKNKDFRRSRGLCVQCAYDDCKTEDQDKKVTYISK